MESDPTGSREIARRTLCERASRQAFWGVSALLFVAIWAGTIAWCASMSTTGGCRCPVAGRCPWRGCGCLDRPGAMLWRYRQSIGGPGKARVGRLTALVGLGYFSVWTAIGLLAFALGMALATVEMQQPAQAHAVPVAAAGIVLMAGLLQFTGWKMRYLACCRTESWRGRRLAGDAGTAWRQGLRLGHDCSRCCAGLMAVLLVIGVMDLRVMVIVAVAITVERLAPAGERVARATGATVVGAGLILLARAAGLG